MIRTTAAALMLAAGLYPDIGTGQAQAQQQDSRRQVQVAPQRDQYKSEIIVTARDGEIAWSDIFRGMSRARGYDDTALDGVLPDTDFRLDSRRAQWTLWAMNRTLEPNVQFKVRHRKGREPQLVVEMDQLALMASKRRFNKMLRNAILPSRYEGRQFGLVFDDDWPEKSKRARHLVVFVHGLNSHSDTVAEMANIVRGEGMLAASFQYPNDQPIDESGQLLKRELNALAKKHFALDVSLVTHSMGALVARVALEDTRGVPLNVERLIMVCPPNRGSALAQFAFGLDLWEYMESVQNDEEMSLFFASIEDGLAEATVDLRPGSVFLTRLNSRPRNPAVDYTIILGTGAPCTQDDLDGVRRRIEQTGDKFRWTRFFGTKLDRNIANLDEVVTGRGDGCVAVKRGKLDGVDDVVLLNFSHLDVLNDPDDPEVKKAYATVVDRLRQK